MTVLMTDNDNPVVASPLDVTVPLWIRLWSWANSGTSIRVPAPVPEIQGDLWSAAPELAEGSLKEFSGHPGPWIRTHGGSEHSNVYHAPAQILRVSRSPEHHHLVDIEALSLLALCDEPVPTLVARGVGWVLRHSIEGDCPRDDGPWVEEVVGFAQRLRTRGLLFLSEVEYPRPNSLTAICGAAMVESIRGAVSYPTRAHCAPTHGDLHANNLLVDGTGHLVAVLDFESMALAPVERDLAIWITVLSGQVGLSAVRRAAGLLCSSIDSSVLNAELLRLLEFVARRALGDPARERTVYTLAHMLSEDPALPCSILAG
jgi:hypothetical protein